MKILYPAKKWLFKVAGVLLFAGILFIIHSCKKDFTKQEQTLSDPEIIKVKDWYQQSFPASASSNNAKSDIAVSSTTSGTPSELDQYIGPDWINTNKYKRFNKNVYEIPLNPDNKFAAALKNPNIGKSYGDKGNSKTSFLILKDDAGYHAYVMFIIADSSYLKGDFTKLARTAYNKRDTDFSGMVLYFTPKGNYLSGYKYQNGHLVLPSGSAYAGKSIQSITTNGKKVATLITTCDDWYWVIRTNGVIVSTTYLYTTCTTLDDGDGSGNGGDGTGIGGPPPVCPPGSTRITTIHVTDDGSPSDGLDSGDGSTGFPPPTTTQPCVVPVVDSLAKVIKAFCDGLSATEKTAINTSVKKFSTSDCPSKFLYNYLVNTKGLTYNFCIDKSAVTNYSFYYDAGSKGFQYANDDMTGPVYSFMLMHEFFHAMQDVTMGGISQYGRSNATGIGSPGFVNIEFEQAVFNDIVTGGRQAFYYGTPTQQKLYDDWLKSLTNDGTIYPKLNANASSQTDINYYNSFINQYNSFLNDFNNISGNVYHSDILQLSPQTLILLFNNVNPNC